MPGDIYSALSLLFKLVLFVTIGAALICGVLFLHKFLAVTQPVGEGILVVEAWIPARGLAEAVQVFNSGRYRCLVLVGGPRNSSEYPTYDDLAARRLDNLGFDTKKLVKVSVPLEPVGRRTLSTAAAVRRWLSSSGAPVCCVDVFTMGTHARKSWVFFRNALGDQYRVGIIAASDGFSNRGGFWFLSRRGIWNFVRNLVGYFYSKIWVLTHDSRSKVRTIYGRLTARGDRTDTHPAPWRQRAGRGRPVRLSPPPESYCRGAL